VPAKKLSRLDPVYFRLLSPPPLTVEFPSVTWTITFNSINGTAGTHNELGASSNRATYIAVSENFNRRQDLEADVFTCFATRHATIGETLLRRLVYEGRAVAMDPPATPPPFGRGQPWNTW
jgi:hypothetical protein